jgi:hypothetical protein
MNKTQRVTLLATAVVLVFMLLFPPFKAEMVNTVRLNRGYAFVLSPPDSDPDSYGNDSFKARVDSGLLVVQLLTATAVGALVCLALKCK